ncbi:hypothetical protein FA95DRAFT_1602833 [Auriscalpium vulgare]|uniref:Uncharacterized protein n=1 Tax=Auriscalpium vulgare TaxID=40419 RepID=A0ACB8S4J1_9AGAM|nr:hypothetical protein FA95DRAFT_1602833 [Auriscalpium vulgare]
MAYRLPTPLEELIPPPRDQIGTHGSRPWSGTMSLTFPISQGMPQPDIYMTAAETTGNSHMDGWPARFYVYCTPMPHVEAAHWARMMSARLPVCTFMPDRHPNPATNNANYFNFTEFSRFLLENQLVALAPWPTGERSTGGGILIYPTASSMSLLHGVVFLAEPFPDSITQRRGNPNDVIPRQYQAPGHPSAYGSSGPGPSSSQRGQYSYPQSAPYPAY